MNPLVLYKIACSEQLLMITIDNDEDLIVDVGNYRWILLSDHTFLHCLIGAIDCMDFTNLPLIFRPLGEAIPGINLVRKDTPPWQPDQKKVAFKLDDRCLVVWRKSRTEVTIPLAHFTRTALEYLAEIPTISNLGFKPEVIEEFLRKWRKKTLR